uniref:uncharacterized protein n=1 Tax=Pristiophorus japonicus TaxID=55135 RepID=UPI00398EF6B3
MIIQHVEERRMEKTEGGRERRHRAVLTGTHALFTFFAHTESTEDIGATTSGSKAAAPDDQDLPRVSSLHGHADTIVSPQSSDDQTVSFSSDPGKWDITSKNLIEYWTEKEPQECQNLDSDFAVKSMFDYVKPNKQAGKREWLIYSPSTKKSVFIVGCFLKARSVSCSVKASTIRRIAYRDNHAMSEQHTLSVGVYHAQKKVSGRIDSQVENQFLDAQSYWKNVLRRVIETIAFLAERGRPFCSSVETIGSKHNGNYLGILQLIAKFDPFLAHHSNEHGNRGKGHTPYLSKTISDEFIAMLRKKTLSAIVDQIRAYYQQGQTSMTRFNTASSAPTQPSVA